MLNHIFTTFYRYLINAKIQLVTIFIGLSLGICVSLLIYLYVQEELSFDRHHTNVERLYRINTVLDIEGKVDKTAKAGLNTGYSLMDHYPQVEAATQFLNIGKQTIKVGTELFSSEEAVYADSTVFTFFDYALLNGTRTDALAGPNKVVISKAAAETYFKTVEKAHGQTININNNNYEVTGVYDERNPTHVPYKIFMSLSSLPKQFLTERNREYIWLTTYSYIKLKQSVIENDFQTLLNDFNEKQLRPYTKKNEINGSITLQLQPVSDIHLDNTFRFDFPGAVNPTYLKIFSSVAFLTLLIALINYVNLTTAKVSKRLKEIGIKKCMGATKRTLFLQFVFETLITVYVCYLFSLLLLYFALPTLNGLTSKTFSFVEILNARFLVYSHLFVIVFAFAASIYPALLLSSFKPVHAIRAAKSIAGTTMIEKLLNPAFIRKSLVVVQFSISIFLIIGTIIIYQQFDFVNSYQLGFDREQIMVIDIPTDTAVSNQIEVVKNKLRELSVVKDVSSSSSIPGGLHGSITMNVSQSGGSEIKVVNIYFVDDKFLDALNLELKEGRFFSKEYATDPQEAFVVNEAAAKFLGWTNPLNMKLESPFGQKGTVVGVVKDFNYKSLHSLIEPLILMNSKTTQGFLLVKLDTKNLAQAVASVSEVWTQFDNAHPYEYFFLDQKFQEQYTKEQNLLRIFTYFSSFAILISCLGLIGLAIFTNEVRVKEIGIRKSLGATDLQIFSLLSRGFLILILLANIIAWPASYWLVNNWLNEFAYKTDINVYPFVLGALIAFAIAFLTIGFFANRAAKGNIIEALKYE